MSSSRRSYPIAAAAALAASLCTAEVGAQSADGVPKLVDLVVDGGSLFASNVRTSRFDEAKLNAQERIDRSKIGDAVIVVVTNQRLIAYGVGGGWRSIPRGANERIERVEAEDYAGLVVTSRRLLNFNGESGVWGELDRKVGP